MPAVPQAMLARAGAQAAPEPGWTVGIDDNVNRFGAERFALVRPGGPGVVGTSQILG